LRNRTFPKENQKKLNAIIKELKAVIKQQDKEIRFLKQELEDLIKPVRTRKKEVKLEPGSEEWKKDFIRRFRKDVLGES
jgi:predicted RNase H-like nuclease (RuvC/YqgF family)